MSFSNSLGISSVFLAFRTWRHSLFSGTSASRTKTLAVTIVSVSVGVVILGGLAKYFKRRKYSPGTRVWKRRTKPNVPLTINSLDADFSSSRRSTSPNTGSLHRQGSTVSNLSVQDPPVKLTPQQLGVMGECDPLFA
ncbi:hypothetical protein M8J76_010750 [Diaphorina citri]|nr:hypothetical protein M8J75_005507 [Diaphorina citri]KAI5737174.1 hypothetical protein M8J76_010750 [Diaphorina citri]